MSLYAASLTTAPHLIYAQGLKTRMSGHLESKALLV